MRGQRADQLVLAERLEDGAPREVPIAPIALGERAEYATSRTSDWTNAYWPRSGERGSTSLDEQLAADERRGGGLETVGVDGR